MRYEIRVEGILDARWSAWFDGLEIRSEAEDVTVIAGSVADQAALRGLLAKVHDLGLPLISLRRTGVGQSATVSSSGADPATLGGHKSEMGKPVILPKIRDLRFVTVRRGGTLQDDDHHLLAMWAADCAEHALHHFKQARPKDDRPRRAIDLGRAWARGEITWGEARTAAGHANAAARDLSGAARHAAYAAGQAAAVGHVAAHELGAAAYAIRAARAAAAEDEREAAGRLECQWQRAQLPHEIRELVLDDQRLRNALCWFAFDC